MALDYDAYMLAIRADFVLFVASESDAFRKIGTSTKNARIRLVKLLFLQGAYLVMDNFNPSSGTNMFSASKMEDFQGIINDIMGTSHEVAWGEIWYNDMDGGIWQNDSDGGIWHNIR